MPPTIHSSYDARGVRPRVAGVPFVLAMLLAWLAGTTAAAAAPAPGFAYRVVSHQTPANLCPGESRRVAVELRNDGAQTWDPDRGDRLAYHWRREDGTMAHREGERTALPVAVAPHSTVRVAARLTAPSRTGRYRLSWRLLREGQTWFPEAMDDAVSVEVAGEGPALAWSVEGFAPPPVAARADVRTRLVVTNEGCAPWSQANGDAMSYRWFSPDGGTQVAEGVRTAWGRDVEPGQRATIEMDLRGPPTSGPLLLRLSPVREGVTWLGPPVRGVAEYPVHVRDAPVQWVWKGAELPTELAAGATLEVPVTLTNTGTQAWEPTLGDRVSYRWTSLAGRPPIEGPRTLLRARVEPGETVAVPLTVVAPPQPGRYRLALEPLREGVAWFGPPAESVWNPAGPEIEVGPPEFAWTLLGVRSPVLPLAGHDREFLLVVRNDGALPWDPARGDRASYEVLLADGTTHASNGRRTPLPRRVEPGEVVQLAVRFDTPRQPGDYIVKFGILREHVRWFPARTPSAVAITLRRRSSLLLVGFAGLLGAMVVAASRADGWVRCAMWPLWTVASIVLLTELFADLSGLQLWRYALWVAVSTAMVPGCLVAACPARLQGWAALVSVATLSLVALADLAYARFFGGLAPLTALVAFHHLFDAKATVSSMIRLHDVVLALPALSSVFLFGVRARSGLPVRRWMRARAVVALCAVGSVPSALELIRLARGALGDRVFSEARNAQRLGFVGAHALQGFRLLRELDRDPLAAEDKARVWEQLAAIRAQQSSQARAHARGIARGANLVLLQVEALQQWVVHAEVGGEPVMPFLSRASQRALEYTDVFDQTSQGRTSDAEYLVLGSGHALPAGALAFLRADNEFFTLAHALADHGYTTYSAHPYRREFWNRSVLHPAYGFKRSDFMEELGNGPRVGWGLADGPFLQRFIDRTAALPEPFAAFGITLSLHHPYEAFPSTLSELNVSELKVSWVRNYVQAMRHFDRALEAMFDALRTQGRLERTMVVVYGDHVTGMATGREVARLAQTRPSRFVDARLRRVPVFIWLPGASLHGVRGVVGGQIDVGVTALHLLGAESPAAAVGSPLVGPGPGFAALPNGGGANDRLLLVRRGADGARGGLCLDRATERPLAREACRDLEARVGEQLELARRILDHNLHREAEARR